MKITSDIKYKVVLYIRKSTESDDQQALSLEKQREACKELLRGIEHEIVETYEESITATKSGLRPGFKKMLSLIQKGKVDCIVTWRMNRLARNPLDQAYIESYLQEGKIKLLLSQDGMFRPDDNVLLLRIYFGESTQYSRNLSKYASEGMLTKVRGGQPVKLPRGYEFDKHKQAIPTVESGAIKEIFRLKKLGYSLKEISEVVYKKYAFGLRGKPLATSSIHNILTNPIYYGAIRYMGEIFEGTFTPIISQRDFIDAQDTSRAKREGNPRVDFARNLIYNHESGYALCPFLSKGNLYFRSTEREGPKINIPFSKIIKYFNLNIHKYEIPGEYKEFIIEGFRDYCMERQGDSAISKEAIAQEMSKIDRKRASLLDMRMNEEIDAEEYKKLKNELSERYFSLAEQIKNLTALDEDICEKGEYCFKLLTNLSQTWKEANIIQNAHIIRMLCFKLSVDKEKALHLAERELFEEVRNLSDSIWLTSWDRLQTPLHMLYACMVHFVKRRDNEKVKELIPD